MTIVVIGAGALGSLIGGLLAEQGESIWLFNPSNLGHIAAMRTGGLRLQTTEGDRIIDVQATSDLHEIPSAPDLLLFTTKAFQTESAALSSHRLAGPSTHVLSLQNGIGPEAVLAAHFDPSSILRGTTAQAATLIGPGVVRWAGRGPTAIGHLQPLPEPSAALKAVLGAFDAIGFASEFAPDVEPLLWNKVLINSAINPMTALYDVPNGRLVEEEPFPELLHSLIDEAIPAVAAHRGITERREAYERVEAVCRATASNLSSMLQDVRARKRTEIEAINGAIVAESERLGRPTPMHRLIMQAILRLAPER